MSQLDILSSFFSASNVWIKALLALSIKSSLILAIAITLSTMAKHRSATVRHGILTIGICAAFLLPAAGLLLPNLEIPLIPDSLFDTDGGQNSNHLYDSSKTTVPRVSRQTNTILFNPLPPAPGMTSESIIAFDPMQSILNPTTTYSIPWQAWIMSLWFAGALVFLILVLSSNFSALRTARHAPSADGRLRKLSTEALDAAGHSRRIRILQSDNISVPLAYCIFHPAIVFPRNASAWSTATIQSVLLHELAHVQRNDILWQRITQVLCVFQWFNPLVWVASRKMMIEREKACDDIVLNQGIKPSNYAANLMMIAESLQRQTKTLWTPAAMVQHNNFKERVMAILDSRTNRKTLGRTGRNFSILAAILFLIPLSAFSPWTRSSNTETQTIDGTMSYFTTLQEQPELKASSHNLQQGDPVLFTLTAPESVSTVTGEFMGQKLLFHVENDGLCALAAVDRKAAPGEYFVTVDCTQKDGNSKGYKISIDVKEREFGDFRIQVKPTDENEGEDTGILKKVYGTVSREPLWKGSFQKPLEGRLSFKFGHNVQFNGRKADYHNGVDISSPAGTPLRASNAGRVVLARRLKTWGNMVVIDHGGGVQTCYAHLAEFAVKEGQMVSKGQKIGTCGSTGRSTAPHVHWMLRVNGIECDPISLVEIGKADHDVAPLAN